jgi:hypothetical protein
MKLIFRVWNNEGIIGERAEQVSINFETLGTAIE